MDNFLPKVLSNIVYNYEQQLRMSDVLNEFNKTYNYKDKNNHCSICAENGFSFKWKKCFSQNCTSHFCNDCYNFEKNFAQNNKNVYCEICFLDL